MNGALIIEAPGPRVQELRSLLTLAGRLSHAGDGPSPPSCVLLVHQPPTFDAPSELDTWSDVRGVPRAAVVVLARAPTPSWRCQVLGAGAMVVLDDRALDAALLSDAIDEARARFTLLRRAVEPPGVRLEAERATLEAVLDAAPAGVVVADAAGRLVRVNAAIGRIWGPTPHPQRVEDYREWPGWWADASERRGRRLEAEEWALARALRGETVRGDIVEIEPFDAPGTRRTMVNGGGPVRDADGRLIGAVATMMDISALVAAEAALRESEGRFRALAENIAQLAWMADAQGEVIWFNRRWFEFTGTTLEEVRGWGWRKVQHPEHLARVEAKWRRHFLTGEPWEDTFPLRSASGEYRWFLSRAVPIRDESGRVALWFGTNTDVTAQREAEEALREADRKKDEFISILAHELRNPLAPARTALEILRRTGPPEPRLMRAREVITRQLTHMARLIDDLLDVSRIARGKLLLQKERCDLVTVSRQTVEDYRPGLEAAGLELTFSADGAAPIIVDADPIRLAQMIGNLLHNSGRFTEAGGRVMVRVRADEAGRSGQVEVEDTGVGISAEMLARLFDPFSQASQDLARSKGGLGLGLALTRGLAELHGGTVRAESEGLGRGARFTLEIPVSASPRPDVAGRPEGAGQGRALSVLVVEDNADAAETLAEVLQLDGHRVRVALDGVRGLALARESAPEVVISDLGLPGALDGYALARALRREAALGACVLVALSGYASEEERRRAFEAGFDHHLAKPPDLELLSRILAEAASPSVPRAAEPSPG
jgi:PAS domain S-box-containing protein